MAELDWSDGIPWQKWYPGIGPVLAKQGFTVYVDYTADWDDGHYVVVVGYDDAHFYFMDPSVLGSYTYLPLEALLARWHDCYLENGQIVRLHHFGLAFTGTTVAYDPAACVPMG